MRKVYHVVLSVYFLDSRHTHTVSYALFAMVK